MKVVFFAAHPDDLDFNCSGTIRKHIFKGDEVYQIYFTSGDLGWLNYGWGRKRLGIKRELEARNAGRKLGVEKRDIHFFRFPDGDLQYCRETIMRTIKILRELKPDRIYTPENRMYLSSYRHHDHIAAGKCVEEAVKHLSYKPKLLVFHSYFPNYLIDITNFYSRDSLSYHETQQIMLKPGKILHHLMASFFGCLKNCRKAEAYRVVAY
jgi:LmbE family N-acetylglucosaminyl deacetylase